MNFSVIYGSDEVVQAFAHFRLGSAHEPPAAIMICLVADFMQALRRDLDGGQSNLTGVELGRNRVENRLFAASVCERVVLTRD